MTCSCQPGGGGETVLPRPDWLPAGEREDGVPVDPCIAPAIVALWAADIHTLGSCCGHNASPPSLVLADGAALTPSEVERVFAVIASVDGREYSLHQWQLATVTPAARPSSDEGTGRPGGWVPGIGWVALLRSLDGADRAHRCPGGDSIRADGVWIGGDYPVIVTRWADGTTPAPPAPTEGTGRPDTWAVVRKFLTRFELNLHGPSERLCAEMDVLATEIADALAASPASDRPDTTRLREAARVDRDHWWPRDYEAIAAAADWIDAQPPTPSTPTPQAGEGRADPKWNLRQANYALHSAQVRWESITDDPYIGHQIRTASQHIIAAYQGTEYEPLPFDHDAYEAWWEAHDRNVFAAPPAVPEPGR